MAMKIICSHNITEILFTLKILQQTCFCLVSEKICRNGAVPYLDAQELQQFLKHFEGKCLYVSVYLRIKRFVPEK